jgi:hypothetical protein
VSNARAYRSVYHRPPNPPPNRAAETETQRSNAAIPVVIVVLGVGFYLSQYSILFPGLFGVMLFFSGLSFLSTRLNPLSPHFYLSRKPSWLATGVVFLAAFALLYGAYVLYVRGLAPIVPHF